MFNYILIEMLFFFIGATGGVFFVSFGYANQKDFQYDNE